MQLATQAYRFTGSCNYRRKAMSLEIRFTGSCNHRRKARSLEMRYTPSGEEKESGIAEKETRAKKSQVLLAQRVMHIRRLRALRRAEAEDSECWKPAIANPHWRQGSEAREGAVAGPSELIDLKGFDRGVPVINVYAEEGGGSGSGTIVAPGSVLKRGDYSPIAAWRSLQIYNDPVPISYNRMRNNSRHVVILADPSFSTDNLLEGLKRMRVVPSALASVIGITVEPPHEAKRLAVKAGLTVPLISDVDRTWMTAHGMASRSLRSIMFILDGATGVVLKIVRDPAVGAVNDYLIEVIGDWRGEPGKGVGR